VPDGARRGVEGRAQCLPDVGAHSIANFMVDMHAHMRLLYKGFDCRFGQLARRLLLWGGSTTVVYTVRLSFGEIAWFDEKGLIRRCDWLMWNP